MDLSHVRITPSKSHTCNPSSFPVHPLTSSPKINKNTNSNTNTNTFTWLHSEKIHVVSIWSKISNGTTHPLSLPLTCLLSLSLSPRRKSHTLCLVPQKISHKQSQNKRKWLLMDKETRQEMPNAKRPHFFDVYSAIFSSQRLVFYFIF